MTPCAWQELWRIATSEPDGDAVIELHDGWSEVTLRWPDGTVTGLYWRNGWHHHETLDTTAGDIAARDAL